MNNRTSNPLIMTLLAALVLAGSACASSSGSRPGDAGPPEPIGDRPSQTEAEFHGPPRGPDVLEVAPPGSGAAQPAVAGDAPEIDVADEIVVSRRQLEHFASKGPAYVFSQVDTEPVQDNGRFIGFQIVDVTEAAHAVMAPHLRVGDVITHVNGVRIQRPDDYLEVWKALPQSASVRIDFLRDGARQQVVWGVQ